LRTGGACRKDKRTADRRPNDMDRTKPVSGVKKKKYLGKKDVAEHRRRIGKKLHTTRGSPVCIAHLPLLSSL